MINRDRWVTTSGQVCSLVESFVPSRRDYCDLAILALAWLQVTRLLSGTRQLARLFSRTPSRHALAQTREASEGVALANKLCGTPLKNSKQSQHGLVWAAFRKSGHGYLSLLRSQAAGGKALAWVLSYASTGWDCRIKAMTHAYPHLQALPSTRQYI